MFHCVVREHEGDLVLPLPEDIVAILNIREGQKMRISVDGSALVLSPVKKPEYTLAELLAETSPSDVEATRDHEWINLKPVGKEIVDDGPK